MRHKIPFFLLLLTFATNITFAKTYPAMCFIYLHDKAGTPYSLTQPDAYLSQRAIARRTRLSIPIDSADLPVNTSYINQITSTGATFYHSSRWMNGVMIYATSSQLQDILSLSFVDSAEQIRPAIAVAKPKLRKPKKRIKTPTLTEPGQNQQIRVDSLHYAGFRGQGIQIAVIDAGFPSISELPGFDSLRNRNGILTTYDFVHDTSYVYHEHEHGSMVLSTMAFNLPGEFIGSAPDADYMLFITENNNEEYLYESDLLTCAFEAADSAGADIATVSLGYFYTDDNDPQFTHSNMNGRHFRNSRAATMAAERGMILCIAAGNEGASDWHYIDTPSDADSILCIGGVDEYGTHSDFSSYGPTADGRIKPEVCARATWAQVACLYPDYANISYSNGTSFSTPISAGAVASLMSALPDVNPAAIRHAILQTASQALKPDTILGYGILNVWAAYKLLTGENPTSLNNATTSTKPTACISNELLLINNYTGAFSLYDITGRLILSDTYDSPFPLPKLPSGIYLLHLPSDTLKIVY